MRIKEFKRQLSRNTKMRQTPLYKKIYKIYFFIYRTKVPYIMPLGAFLWYFSVFLRKLWGFFKENFYSQQITRYRCKVGKHLWIPGGAPFFMGDGKIVMGDNVRMWGTVDFFVGGDIYEEPTLIIGNNVGIGGKVGFSVKQKIIIGNNVGIGGETLFFDNPHHLIELATPSERFILPINKEDCAPIVVEDDVWISERCVILKGVTIGKGSVVGINSTVVKDVPPYTLVAGSPAREIKKLKRPEDFKSKKSDLE
jgi:acetyltransferase-like isoleucine patch superfamily enzyme